MSDFRDQKGFTLIEILMVIFIVGILSVMAINGYTEYRRTALLDLGGENLVSQISEMRDRTIYGDFGGSRLEEIKTAIDTGQALENSDLVDAKCYGIHFKKGEKSLSFSQQFENKMVWKHAIQNWGFDGCTGDLTENEMDLGEIKIEEITLDNTSAEEIFLKFYPPKGTLEVLIANDLQSKKYKVLKIKIRYGDTKEDRYTRFIKIDLNSLKSEINEKDV